MSGHSHYATIHRQKELKDAQKGSAFSKMARAIQIAVKTGGGADPDTNFKLRIAIEKAREVNMPKDNIQRAIDRAGGSEALDEAMYEGFGPGGFGVLVEVATDNKNRTAQEIKNILERAGGSLAGPGSVSFNFSPKGLIRVKKAADSESQMLSLIDLGVDDVEEVDGEIEAYTSVDKLRSVSDALKASGNEVLASEMVQKPVNMIEITGENAVKKAVDLLDKLSDHDDVQKVFANADFV